MYCITGPIGWLKAIQEAHCGLSARLTTFRDQPALVGAGDGFRALRPELCEGLQMAFNLPAPPDAPGVVVTDHRPDADERRIVGTACFRSA